MRNLKVHLAAIHDGNGPPRNWWTECMRLQSYFILCTSDGDPRRPLSPRLRAVDRPVDCKNCLKQKEKSLGS